MRECIYNVFSCESCVLYHVCGSLQSTINPVDGVFQPTPLNTSVVSASAMPTQTTLPTGEPSVCLALSPFHSLTILYMYFHVYFEGFLTFVVYRFGNSKIRFGLQILCVFTDQGHMKGVFSSVDGAQVCKTEQRPSSLPVGPVVTVMGSLQTPTPNSTGTNQQLEKVNV